MITKKNIENLFSDYKGKDVEELEKLYLSLALEVHKKTKPNDLTREAILALRESLDLVKASLAMESDQTY